MTIKGSSGPKNAVIQMDNGFIGYNFKISACLIDGES